MHSTIVKWMYSCINNHVDPPFLGAIYLRKSYNEIAEQTNVETFKTTGTLYLNGTATIIIIVGFLIILIARIFEIISYFSLSDSAPLKVKDDTSTQT
ncbi:MAG: DUF996 domain-containing protein [Candidatus Thermoplasmatota archaeon]|nr:DUF996 domain-containing protein [Candidatus Thermoplasmatota archaeon]